MKKILLVSAMTLTFAALTTVAFACPACGDSSHSSAYVDIDQSQDNDRHIHTAPGSSHMSITGNQEQDQYGVAVGQSASVTAHQNQDQARNYFSSLSNRYSLTEVAGGYFQSEVLNGSARNYGAFGGENNQLFSTAIRTGSNDPSNMYTNTAMYFNQSANGGEFGNGNSNSLQTMGGYASYFNLTQNRSGDTWVMNSGFSDATARLTGNTTGSPYSHYDGGLTGRQYSTTMNSQDPSGQTSSIVAGTSLSALTHGNMRAGATASQEHSYAQLTTVNGGYSFQAGNVAIRTAISQ